MEQAAAICTQVQWPLAPAQHAHAMTCPTNHRMCRPQELTGPLPTPCLTCVKREGFSLGYFKGEPLIFFHILYHIYPTSLPPSLNHRRPTFDDPGATPP